MAIISVSQAPNVSQLDFSAGRLTTPEARRLAAQEGAARAGENHHPQAARDWQREFHPRPIYPSWLPCRP